MKEIFIRLLSSILFDMGLSVGFLIVSFLLIGRG